MKIKTNNARRDLLELCELSERERADVDYVTDDEDGLPRFFRYRGALYDIDQFSRIAARSSRTWSPNAHGVEDGSPLLAWDAIQTDSYFSGVVFRFAKDETGRADYCRVVVGVAYA